MPDFALVTLPANRFPHTLEGVRSTDGVVVWRREITGPGAYDVPALAAIHGCPIDIRCTWPSGEVTLLGARP